MYLIMRLMLLLILLVVERVVLLVFDVVLIASEVLFVAIDEWREDPGDANSIVVSSVGSCGFIG